MTVFNAQITDTTLVLTNQSRKTQSVPLGGRNAIELPGGAVIQAPTGKYWHIDINETTGGAKVESNNIVSMPVNSQTTWNADV